MKKLNIYLLIYLEIIQLIILLMDQTNSYFTKDIICTDHLAIRNDIINQTGPIGLNQTYSDTLPPVCQVIIDNLGL
jgi:hypothetical protein